MYDFVDGKFCRTSPIFQARSIQILAYFDDIELVNPIGAFTKKHKLSVFYWTLFFIFIII